MFDLARPMGAKVPSLAAHAEQDFATSSVNATHNSEPRPSFLKCLDVLCVARQ